MWNENSPLELLKNMPSVLSDENLADIQQAIDADKYENSKAEGRDLCGEYAPFCELCDKTLTCPCAQAYIKMKQNEGVEIEVASKRAPRRGIRIAVAKRVK